MMSKSLVDRIRRLCPCSDAVDWLNGFTDPAAAWSACDRGDWMLWLLGRLAGSPESDARRKLVLCACDCAAIAMPHTKDVRVGACIETARKWAKGEATLSELCEARNADADAAADAAAARKKTLAACADIVRHHYPEPPEIPEASDQ